MTRNPFEDFDLPHGFDKPMTPPELAQFILCEENYTPHYSRIRDEVALIEGQPGRSRSTLIDMIASLTAVRLAFNSQSLKKLHYHRLDDFAVITMTKLLDLAFEDTDDEDDLSPFGDVA